MHIYREVVLRSVRVGEVASALKYAEQSRSRTFLDLLAWTELAKPEGLALETVQEEIALHQSLRTLAISQRETKSETLRRTLALQAANLLERLEEIIDVVSQAAPEYAALRKATPVHYAEIKECLVIN